jgi:hypothetical protein
MEFENKRINLNFQMEVENDLEFRNKNCIFESLFQKSLGIWKII